MEEDLSKLSHEELLSVAQNTKSELSKTNKKNQRLEEQYIKVFSELKNLKSDKSQLEIFLKQIFPKETHETAIHSEYGLYESEELKKIWLISETQKENQFQKILNQSKEEIIELSEKNKKLSETIEEKIKEISNFRNTLNDNQEQLSFYINNFKTISKKNFEIENEKTYLLNLIDTKNREIEKLKDYEIEIAEMKAQYLLMDGNNDYDDYDDNFGMSSFKPREKIDRNSTTKESSNSLTRLDSNTNNNYKLKIGKFSILYLDTLNSGCQTNERLYSEDEMNKVVKENEIIKSKFDNLKGEFTVSI